MQGQWIQVLDKIPGESCCPPRFASKGLKQLKFPAMPRKISWVFQDFSRNHLDSILASLPDFSAVVPGDQKKTYQGVR